MTSKTANRIASMIYCVCRRHDGLAGLCEDWDVTTDDFDEFIDNALKGYMEDKDEV